MIDSSVRPWMALRAIEGLGDITLRRLIAVFGGPDKIFSAGRDQLIVTGELTVRQADAILRGPGAKAQSDIDREFRALERSSATVIVCTEQNFPSRLREIPDPPLFLYLTGALVEADQNAVAIVGSRLVTPKGRLVTEELSCGLAAAGFTIVSGLARGVDTAAHQAALSAQGRTLAVMGCGIDRTYPPECRTLRTEIERNGAVLTELPLGSPPIAQNFPRRNRIISGMCLGVVVTEAANESGSLITARLAAEQGREVFAVPGFVKEHNSQGTNRLIQQGATLVQTVDEIIEELLPQLEGAFRNRIAEHVQRRSAICPSLSRDQAVIYEHLSYEPIDLDALIAKIDLPIEVVSSALLAMELGGLVRQLPGPCIIRL